MQNCDALIWLCTVVRGCYLHLINFKLINGSCWAFGIFQLVLKETATWTVACEKHSVVILHHCSDGFWTEKCVILIYEHEIGPDE
jgi:hypothetical protein